MYNVVVSSPRIEDPKGGASDKCDEDGIDLGWPELLYSTVIYVM